MNINIIIYTIMLLVSFCFTYIFDCEESQYLLYLLLLMLVVDIFSVVCYFKAIKVNIVVPKEHVQKNDLFTVDIFLVNTSILPIINVEVKLILDGYVSSKGSFTQKISLGFREKARNSIKLSALHVGKGNIILDSLQVNGIFNLLNKKIHLDKQEQIVIEPRILKIKISENIDNNNKLINKGKLNDEIDYEYDKYVLGSPVSRINWKLFSKRNELIMRKDLAEQEDKKYTLLLDYDDSAINKYKNYDDSVEIFISLASILLQKKMKVEAFICNGLGYMKLAIDSQRDIINLKKQIHISSSHDEVLLQTIKQNKEGKYIFVTNRQNADRKYSVFGEDIYYIYIGMDYGYGNHKNNNGKSYMSYVTDYECFIERV